MVIKHLAVSAAAVAATLIATPAFSQELTTPMTKFFISVPLDAKNAKEQMPNFGLQFQGSRPYQTVTVDYKTFRLVPAAVAGAIEAKYIVAGALAVGAAVAVAHKDSKTSASFAQQQADQKAACPATC